MEGLIVCPISGTEPCCPVLWRRGHKSYFQTPGMKGMFSPGRLPVKCVGDPTGVIHVININKQGICKTTPQVNEHYSSTCEKNMTYITFFVSFKRVIRLIYKCKIMNHK